MSEDSAHVGILTVELNIPMSNSLKAKRRVLRSIKDRIRSSFNVSIAEVAYLDKWQKSGLGMSIIGNDRGYLDARLNKILAFLETVGDIQVVHSDLEFV